MREGVGSRRLLRNQLFQPVEVTNALLRQIAGERNGLTVLVEGHQVRHLLRLARDTQLQTVQQAVKNVRGVQFARHQLVAHRRPARLFGRHNSNAVFLSNPFRAAITTGAQSVRGINPIRTVSCSGLSDPAAHAACMTPGNSIAPLASMLACNNRRLDKSAIIAPEKGKKKRPTVLKHRWTPLS